MPHRLTQPNVHSRPSDHADPPAVHHGLVQFAGLPIPRPASRTPVGKSRTRQTLHSGTCPSTSAYEPGGRQTQSGGPVSRMPVPTKPAPETGRVTQARARHQHRSQHSPRTSTGPASAPKNKHPVGPQGQRLSPARTAQALGQRRHLDQASPGPAGIKSAAPGRSKAVRTGPSAAPPTQPPPTQPPGRGDKPPQAAGGWRADDSLAAKPHGCVDSPAAQAPGAPSHTGRAADQVAEATAEPVTVTSPAGKLPNRGGPDTPAPQSHQTTAARTPPGQTTVGHDRTLAGTAADQFGQRPARGRSTHQPRTNHRAAAAAQQLPATQADHPAGPLHPGRPAASSIQFARHARA